MKNTLSIILAIIVVVAMGAGSERLLSEGYIMKAGFDAESSRSAQIYGPGPIEEHPTIDRELPSPLASPEDERPR